MSKRVFTKARAAIALASIGAGAAVVVALAPTAQGGTPVPPGGPPAAPPWEVNGHVDPSKAQHVPVWGAHNPDGSQVYVAPFDTPPPPTP